MKKTIILILPILFAIALSCSNKNYPVYVPEKETVPENSEQNIGYGVYTFELGESVDSILIIPSDCGRIRDFGEIYIEISENLSQSRRKVKVRYRQNGQWKEKVFNQEGNPKSSGDLNLFEKKGNKENQSGLSDAKKKSDFKIKPDMNEKFAEINVSHESLEFGPGKIQFYMGSFNNDFTANLLGEYSWVKIINLHSEISQDFIFELKPNSDSERMAWIQIRDSTGKLIKELTIQQDGIKKDYLSNN